MYKICERLTFTIYSSTIPKGGDTMLRSFKTEIDPTPEQMRKINKTIGTCRFVYNLFIAQKQELVRERRAVQERSCVQCVAE